MDKNSFRELLSKTVETFSLVDDGAPNEVENEECMQMYDEMCYEAFPHMPYAQRTNMVFKMYILKLMHWRYKMENEFPFPPLGESNEDVVTQSNVIDFSNFRKAHAPRRYVG